jgi:non-specific serine/threonine protein kinase
VLDLLEALIDKSLVVAEARAAKARYRLLESIRAYAVERLTASGEAAAVRDRHRDWFLARAEAGAALAGVPQSDWFTELAIDHDNLRAAFAWSLGEGRRPAAALRLTMALEEYWSTNPVRIEGRTWFDRALAAVGDSEPALRARPCWRR